jgi:hypothetical protein
MVSLVSGSGGPDRVTAASLPSARTSGETYRQQVAFDSLQGPRQTTGHEAMFRVTALSLPPPAEVNRSVPAASGADRADTTRHG